MNLMTRITMVSFACLILTVVPANAAILTVTKTADTYAASNNSTGL